MRHTERELDRVLDTGPFHLALRTALSVRGLPLHRVQHHLAHRGVKLGVTSLSYWQQGVRRPRRPESLRAVRALEDVLALPDDSLLRLLRDRTKGPAARTGSARRRARTARCWSPPGRWNGCWRRWSHRWTAGCTRWTTRSGYGSGPGASWRAGPRSMSYGRTGTGSTAIWRSTGAIRGATRRGSPYGRERTAGPGGCAGTRRRGCWWRSCSSTPGCGAGETYVFGYGFEDGTGGASDEYVRGFTFGGGQYVLQVGFDEGALPVRCRRFEQASAGAPRAARRT